MKAVELAVHSHPDRSASTNLRLGLVCAASCSVTLARYLLASPCLARPKVPVLIRYGAGSAGEAFNQVYNESSAAVDWWVWAHQDVFLPGTEWFDLLQQRLQQAIERWPNLAVVGAYGINRDGQRAGRVLDRGQALHEPSPLPALVQGLDEMLLVVSAASSLRMDPALGFDFYGTDLALQAERDGWQAAVLDIACEHWSNTPATPPFPTSLIERIGRSASEFEHKWQHILPVQTPCFHFSHTGAAQQLLEQMRCAG